MEHLLPNGKFYRSFAQVSHDFSVIEKLFTLDGALYPSFLIYLKSVLGAVRTFYISRLDSDHYEGDDLGR